MGMWAWSCWRISPHLLCARTSQPTLRTSGLAISTLFWLFWPVCVCERTCSLPIGSAGQDGATAPTWEYLLAPLKNSPRIFLLDLRLPQRICLDLGFDSPQLYPRQAGVAPFPQRPQLTTLLREREEWGSGCIWRVGRGKGCLRPLSAWGSCRAGKNDQESSYFSFPGLLTPPRGPPL